MQIDWVPVSPVRSSPAARIHHSMNGRISMTKEERKESMRRNFKSRTKECRRLFIQQSRTEMITGQLFAQMLEEERQGMEQKLKESHFDEREIAELLRLFQEDFEQELNSSNQDNIDQIYNEDEEVERILQNQNICTTCPICRLNSFVEFQYSFNCPCGVVIPKKPNLTSLTQLGRQIFQVVSAHENGCNETPSFCYDKDTLLLFCEACHEARVLL
eukprot:c8114_g1_i1.p1 GENE.c8114_g1_i1~~c8114_g1_i1.p1  ORF type:complete len:223 (-),score=85.87 c8114_g1_i1:36-683(-)